MPYLQGAPGAPPGREGARLQGRPPGLSHQGRDPGDARGGRAQARSAGRSGVTRFVVVIPARYASSRFPGKALADIAGKPMVVRVAERAAQSGAKAVYVATDDARIESATRAHGFESIATGAGHATGT